MSMKFKTLLLSVLMSTLFVLPAFAQLTPAPDNGGINPPVSQCNDKIDNDKDGGIDTNGFTVTVNPGGGAPVKYPADKECKAGIQCEDGTTKCVTPKTGDPSSRATSLDLKVRINNPLKVDTIEGAIQLFMNAVLRIALPFIIIFFIWSGFSFVLARGNPEKVKTAKNMFWYTIIGTLLILGAWTITNAIIGTVNSITG